MDNLSKSNNNDTNNYHILDKISAKIEFILNEINTKDVQIKQKQTILLKNILSDLEQLKNQYKLK